MPTLAGSGAIRSTANDLFVFLRAVSPTTRDAPLRPAIDMLLATRRPTSNPRLSVALGWFVSTEHDDEVVWKTGGTGGYYSFVGFSTRSNQGAVALSNAGFWNPFDDIGMHLVNTAFPLVRHPPQITVDAATLAAYSGTYVMSPEFALTIRAKAGAALCARYRTRGVRAVRRRSGSLLHARGRCASDLPARQRRAGTAIDLAPERTISVLPACTLARPTRA
jgi:serine-type D-Ala-D-Ala carboxypeptidase/endopeptidase